MFSFPPRFSELQVQINFGQVTAKFPTTPNRDADLRASLFKVQNYFNYTTLCLWVEGLITPIYTLLINTYAPRCKSDQANTSMNSVPSNALDKPPWPFSSWKEQGRTGAGE